MQLGIGRSQEIDSNMAGRALLWSYGASVQDANEQGQPGQLRVLGVEPGQRRVGYRTCTGCQERVGGP